MRTENFDITAAAESVASAAGESWPALSSRLLYAPLGMDHTYSTHAELVADDNHAVGHMPVDGEWAVSDPQRLPDAQSPAGGAASNIEDMLRWVGMILDDGGELIDAPALLPAITPQIVASSAKVPTSRPGYYGYGFNAGTTSGGLTTVSHSGAFLLGAGTTFSMLPSADLGIVVLTNGQANGVAEAIAAEFNDLVQYGDVRQDWLGMYRHVFDDLMAPVGDTVGEEPPSSPAPSAAAETYAGQYDNLYFGPATVALDGDGLMLRLGPKGEWPLEHWNGDSFVFSPGGENAPAGSRSLATFDGMTLVLEFYDEHGMGTFVRR